MPAALEQPWFTLPTPLTAKSNTVVVIGAGLAGSATAHALAKRGLHCTVLDAGSGIASGGSGVPVAVYKPHVSRIANPASRFFESAFNHLLAELGTLSPHNCGEPKLFTACGLLQRINQWKNWPQAANWSVHNLRTASEIAGVDLQQGRTDKYQGALHFPNAGYLWPAALCQQWLNHPLINYLPNTNVAQITRAHDHWNLIDPAGHTIHKAIIVVSALGAGHLETLRATETQISHGQINQFQAPAGFTLPRCVITGHGVAIPQNRSIWCGSTHDRVPANDQLLTSSTQPATHSQDKLNQNLMANYCRLHNLLGCTCAPPWQVISQWNGRRASTPDRLPLVGPVADCQYYREQYRELHHGRKQQQFASAKYHPGLYTLNGLGSRGASIASYCGELLAQIIIDQESIDVSPELLHLLHPARFLIRQLKRQAR